MVASESFVSCHLMVDSMWEDMNDDGQRIFWLPDACLTQCEKTGVATAKSRMFVTCVDFAPLWDEMLYRPCQDFDHSENVAFVRQTEFYRFCICCFDNQLHIRALSFCGQVLFRSCIVIGLVTLVRAGAAFLYL